MEPEPEVTYARRAVWAGPVDGDSFWLVLDHGRFPLTRSLDEIEARVRGLYAPELGKPGGEEAAKFTHDLLVSARRITVRTHRTRTGRTVGSFARVICDVWADGEPVAAAVIAAGHGSATPVEGFTKPGGEEAAKFTHDLLVSARRITVRTHRTRTGRTVGSFARVICDVWADGEPVAAAVIAAGHGSATPVEGFTKPALPPVG